MARGSHEVLEAFRLEIQKRGLKGKVRANKAGCLDQCAFGPSVVIYPEAVWYAKVSPKDVPEIVDAMLKGEVLKRCLFPFNTLQPTHPRD
jgi:(2Fe-2S) ferredoxin